ncbi:MAG: ABC transporter ATP-binding protein [Clostridia bacterium]|nr:ABC transporter ATP-binding protein [Clostridia bacterium]
MIKNIIEISNLRKTYGEVRAVDDISFSVKEGEFFAFLGLNGAGKSTTINIICGGIKKDSGKVVVDGVNIDEDSESFRSKIGVVYQESVLDKSLSVKDNLENRAALYGIINQDYENRLNEIDKLLGIKEILKKPFGKLSGGQKRKVDIARAIIHNPKILILDEPTTGLDPQTRRTVWQALESIQKQFGTTIFLTTHYMEEVTDAHNIVILDGGKIVAQGSPLELKNRFTGDFIRLYHTDEKQVKKLGMPYENLPECYKIEVKNTQEATQLILKYPDIFQDYEITKGKIDDVFLAVTGKKLNEVSK